MTYDSVGFTIKTVSERTGVSVHTLRAWERRYGVPSPNRGADNRYRLYDESDIADVLFLKQKVESGVAPAQASAMLRQRQDAAPSLTIDESTHQPIVSLQNALLEAFAKSDETAARHLLDEAFALYAPEQVALSIIEPTMKEIGDRWMRAEMTVWHEHLASNVVQQKLYSVLQSQPVLPDSAPMIAAACAPNEEHQVGLIVFALLARRQGWRVAYLGQGTPLADLVDLSRSQLKPSIIAVSVTTVVGLAGLIPWLDANHRPDAPLVFGGRMPTIAPTLRAHLPGSFLGDNVLAAIQQLASVKMRTDFWSPSKRARHAVDLLESHRLKLAGETISEIVNSLNVRSKPKWKVAHLNEATQFLIDGLACALAFDAPELMDVENRWLKDAMPPRVVTAQSINQHLETFARVLRRVLPREQAQLFDPLIERMQKNNLE